MNQSAIKPLIVCGPSGVGKGTLLETVKELFPNTFGVSVSHTTRKPRDGERNGIKYHFITKEMFKNKLSDNEFIEDTEYCGNYYGTSFKAVETVQQKHLICILEIAIQSAEYIKNNVANMDANYLFITCKGKTKTLKQRLINRNSETEESMQKRLNIAMKEFQFVEENKDLFDCIISNDDLKVAAQQVVHQLKEWYPYIHATSRRHLPETKINVVPYSPKLQLGKIMREKSHEINTYKVMYQQMGNTAAVCCILGIGALCVLVTEYI